MPITTPRGKHTATLEPHGTAHGSTPTRVSTLELFFDLVFVFTITQVTHLVEHAHGAGDLARAFLVLVAMWWMYGGYAWLTNNVALDAVIARLLMIGGMLGFFVMALSVPRVWSGDGVPFALAYLVVVLIHATLFTHAPNSSARAIWHIVPYNVGASLLLLAGGFLSQRYSWIAWLAAIATLVSATFARAERSFTLNAAHFAERHGLIMLIVLGETIISIGKGAGETPVRLPLITAAIFGLSLVAALWWSYFDRDDTTAEHAMARANAEERARLGIQAYWFAHLVLIVGVVVAAAGLHGVVADITQPTTDSAAWYLAVGVAIYLVGEAIFRRIMSIGPTVGRYIAAGFALATAPLGLLAGSLPQLGLLVLVLVAMLLAEKKFVV
jgi:low temperature requirement protein LtrA